MSTHTDYGPCCACGKHDMPVRIVLRLNYRAPIPGTGWGCQVCGLPNDGALAVVCEECLEQDREPRFAAKGDEFSKDRAPISELESVVFEHNQEAHERDRAYDYWYDSLPCDDDCEFCTNEDCMERE